MGNLGILKFLSNIAKYCDCLESGQLFQHQKNYTQKSQISESENKEQLTQKQVPQPRRQIKMQVQNFSIEQPAKIYKPLPPQPSLKRRSNLQIRQTIKLPNQLQQISEISQSPQVRKKDELKIIDFSKDQDIKAGKTSYSNPFYHSHQNLNQRQKATINRKRYEQQKQVQQVDISQIDEPYLQQDYQAQFFIDSEDQSQYNEKKVNKSSYTYM